MAETTKLCSVDGCQRAEDRRGLCTAHYQRWYKTGDVRPDEPIKLRRAEYVICRIEGCERTVACRGWCSAHYRCWKLYGDPLRKVRKLELTCTVIGCDRPAKGSSGYCGMHYQRVRTQGDPGPAQSRKTGCGYIDQHGYRIISRAGREAAEHRFKMEDLLGRPLSRRETVHHINGDRADNHTDGPLVAFRSGNLELWSSGHPYGQRVSDKIVWAIELLEQYAPDKLK